MHRVSAEMPEPPFRTRFPAENYAPLKRKRQHCRAKARRGYFGAKYPLDSSATRDCLSCPRVRRTAPPLLFCTEGPWLSRDWLYISDVWEVLTQVSVVNRPVVLLAKVSVCRSRRDGCGGLA